MFEFRSIPCIAVIVRIVANSTVKIGSVVIQKEIPACLPAGENYIRCVFSVPKFDACRELPDISSMPDAKRLAQNFAPSEKNLFSFSA